MHAEFQPPSSIPSIGLLVRAQQEVLKNDKVQTFSGSLGRNAARRSKFAQETHVRHQLRCVDFQSSNLIPSMGLFLAKNSFLPLEGAISTLSFRKYTRKQFSIRCMFPVNFKALAQIASEIIGGSQKNDKVQKIGFFAFSQRLIKIETSN